MRRASLEFVKNTAHRPNAALGQNFFINADRLIECLNELPLSGRPVLEIGPGLGALTELLLERASAVTCVEIDRELADYLSRELSAKVICADALRLNTDFLTPNHLVVGNLPYYITSDLIEKYLCTQAGDFMFMVQKEAAERFFASPSHKNYGAIAIICSLFFDIRVLAQLDSSCYYPQPKVDSAMVYLHRHGQVPQGFLRFIKTCMHMRRKTLSNNLKAYPNAQAVLSELSIDPRVRAEALSAGDILRLFERLESN